MKHLLFLIIAFGCTLPVVATQIDCTNFKIKGGVDALYWRAYERGVDYAFYNLGSQTEKTEINENVELQPDYGWGFRIFGRIDSLCTCRFAELEWIYFRNTTTASVGEDWRKGFLRANSGGTSVDNRVVGGAKARQRDRYNNVTLRVAQIFYQDCRGSFYGYLGGGWRDIHVNDVFSYKPYEGIPDPASRPIGQNTTLHFSGGAILFGLGGDIHLGCGVGAELRTGFLTVIGSLRYDYAATGTNAQGVVGTNRSVEPSQVNGLAAYEAQGSIYYERQCGCLCLRGEVGFRIEYFFSLTAKNNFDTNTNEPTEQVNRGYGGPFFGVSVQY